MQDKVLIVSSKEYVLLAAAAGAEEIYGFDMAADSIQEHEAIIALHGLTAKGYVESDGEKIILKDKMKVIFETITGSGTIIDVHKRSGRKCIFYIGKTAVKVVQSLRRPDSYEISIMPVSGVWQHLAEEGWIGDSV